MQSSQLDTLPPTPRVLELAVETDYELFELFGDLKTEADYITLMYAAMSDIFLRDANISVELTFVRLWDTPEDLFNEESPLSPFRNYWNDNMQEVVRQDYIRTARAKGVPPRQVIWRHAFRNTLIPLVTLMGLTLPSLLSGAVILEQIFTWPGMGRLYFEAISRRDYDIVMGLTLVFSVLTLLGQLLADLLYAVVDPRVTYH